MTQARIKGVYPIRAGHKVVDIFGHSSRGIPGIQIVGLGKLGNTIKEKLIYLTRMQNVKFPFKRFVLCLEKYEDNKEISSEDFRWLELPLLITFWSLAGLLPIAKLEDCITSGTISVSGEVTCMPIPDEILEKHDRIKYIMPVDCFVPENVYHLPVESLFENKQAINFDFLDRNFRNCFPQR